MNPFIALHESLHGSDFDRIGSGWEDTLTENFAHLLRVDVNALRAVTEALVGSTREAATSIRTQYCAGNDRPDIAIELDSGRLLLIECKVDANLGHRQLERYLALTSDSGHESYCALVSRRHLAISPSVLESSLYLRPAMRDHWLWQDIFNVIPKPVEALGVHYLRRCFLNYLELLGLAPTQLPNVWLKLLDDDDDARNARIAFGKLLGGTRKWFRERGFAVTGDSQSGLQARPGGGCEFNGGYLWLSLNPAPVRRHLMEPEYSHRIEAPVFRIALVFESPEPPPEALWIFREFPRPLVDPNAFEWWPVAPYRMGNRRTRLEVVAALSPFIGDGTGIDQRLALGCACSAERLLRLEAQCRSGAEINYQR